VSGNSVESILDRIDADISDQLVFAGILDNNAKLLSFRRGKASFALPIERHDTLDVQLSLMFSLIRQLEDISGVHKFSIVRFGKHDIYLFGSPDLHVFVMTSPGSEAQIAKKLGELVSALSGTEPPVAAPPFSGRSREPMTISPQPSQSRRSEEINERQRTSLVRQNTDPVSMLQGYLLALDMATTIEDEEGGYYKIKSTNNESKLEWAILEKINSLFKDMIKIHHMGVDSDGRLFIGISAK
jgi:hypothetical protein